MERVSRQPTETIRLWLPVRGLGGGSRPFVEVESLVCLGAKRVLHFSMCGWLLTPTIPPNQGLLAIWDVRIGER